MLCFQSELPQHSIDAWIVPIKGKQWVNLLDELIVRLWPVILHSTASHVATVIPIWPMRCISIVLWEISTRRWQWKARWVPVPMSMNGRPGRTDPTELNIDRARGTVAPTLVRYISTPTPILASILLPINSGPRSLTSSPTPSCPHIVTPQPLVHMQQDDPIKRRSSLFPRTKRTSPYQHPSAVHESLGAREWKEKYSKYQTRHPSRLKSRIWKAYDDDVSSSSRHVLLIAA
jgi:hypothetical protein